MGLRGNILRGEIYMAKLDPALGSETGKERRVLVISNDVGNQNPKSPVVTVVPITKQLEVKPKKGPMYIPVFPTKDNGLEMNSVIDCGQIRVLDIDIRLSDYKGFFSKEIMNKVNKSIETMLQLKSCPKCESVLLPNKNHCVKCKFVLVRVCLHCLETINSLYKYCPHCGKEGSETE